MNDNHGFEEVVVCFRSEVVCLMNKNDGFEEAFVCFKNENHGLEMLRW